MKHSGAIACAGNWIVDLVHETDSWPQEGNLSHIGDVHYGVGGGAANVASDLRYLDPSLELFALGCIGQDEFGESVQSQCASLHLDASQLNIMNEVRTSHTHVFSVRGKSRTFLYHPGANDLFKSSDVNFSELVSKGVSTFYLGYPLLLKALDTLDGAGSCDAATLLSHAKSSGMLTCVDLVSSGNEHYQAVIRAILPYVDILVLNEVELELATGLTVANGEDTIDETKVTTALQVLLEAGVSKAVVFHTVESACWASTTGQFFWARSLPLASEDIKSSVGAGDAFCAGVLYAAHQSCSPQEALRLGHLAARASLYNETAAEAIPTAEDLLALP